MAIDRSIPGEDHRRRSNGTRRAQTYELAGPIGLERLSGPATFSARDPERFRARLTHLQIHHIGLEVFAANSYTSVRSLQHLAAPAPATLTLVFVRTGSMHVEIGSDAFEIDSTTFLAMDSRDAVRVRVDAEVHVLASMLPIDRLPKHLQERGGTIAAPIIRGPLADAFVAFHSTVLGAAVRGGPIGGGLLVQAMTDLHAAVVVDARRLTDRPKGQELLRTRMEAYIESHLSDPGLAPETIARALGVSLRQAHKVFNDEDRTIGRHIRDRRLERVASTLRVADTRFSLADLAAQHGFVSGESLSRAFRSRYGTSPSGYRARR